MTRLFDLPIRFASRWVFNCYVVDDGGDGAPLVVDAGLRCTARQALALVREHTSSDTKALTVVSTHGHSDHVGGIATLMAQWPTLVLLPARCEAYLNGEAPRSPGPREVAKIFPVLAEQPFDWTAARDFVAGSHEGYGRAPRMQLSFTPDGYLRDGDSVAKASDWQVIHAPGHTDDSTCLYHADSCTLFAGDAVLTHEGRAWFNPEVVDPKLSRDTEERMRELDVRHLLPGHGVPLAGHALLRDARSFKERPTGGGVMSRLARGLGRW